LSLLLHISLEQGAQRWIKLEEAIVKQLRRLLLDGEHGRERILNKFDLRRIHDRA
jgi:hypothetical protein